MRRIWISILIIIPAWAFAWGPAGHRLIATIAYDRLTPAARLQVNQLTAILDQHYPPFSRFLYASVWPDLIRSNGMTDYNQWHFIDYPFSTDGTPVMPPNPHNVLWAIAQSEKILQDPKTSRYEKAIYLRFLIHFVGDVHQPLHCAERFSKAHPEGDHGGNDVVIQNRYAQNLHTYWDQGLGLFRQKSIAHLARIITIEYPPSYFGAELNDSDPQDWARESFALAKNFAYNIPENSVPSLAYNAQGQKIVAQQIALAGYRLANLLNTLFP